MANLLFPVLLLAVMYAFLILPQKKKQKARAEMLASINPGDEIVTTGGIYGGVVEIKGDDVYLEIAPDVEVRITRGAVADRVYRVVAADAAEPEADAAQGADAGDDEK
ncbi:MAG: preprotein translocase subunit YajC [Actinobacteria bacterium]|nr:preprotein translocase subunit YajC [Actinomycetota bacterium]